MLEKNDLIQIGEIITQAIESQDERLNKRFDGIEQRLDGVEQRLERLELKSTAIQEQLLLISQRLDNIELKLDRHIKGNNEDLGLIIKELEIEKKKIKILEEQIQRLMAVAN